MDRPIDIVCIKHGDKIYDWSYVDKLYRGAVRSFSRPINFTVFTDTINPNASYNQVLLPDFKELEGWEKGRGAWWFKMWLFSNDHPIQNQFIYFDLDVLLVNNCDFLLDVPEDSLGIVLETKWSHKPGMDPYYLNTSVMVINPLHHNILWRVYSNNRHDIQRHNHGDQTFVTNYVYHRKIKFTKFDSTKVVFWKFDVHNGGVKNCYIRGMTDDPTPGEFPRKIERAFSYNTPGTDVVTKNMSVIIFNGASNKPTQFMNSEVIQKYWV